MLSPINLKNWNQTSIMSWLHLYDTILTDCDGVLWHDNEVIPQVTKTINIDLWLKANKMNFLIDESHFIAPTFSIAEYLSQRLGKEEKVYVIGSAALRHELNNFNILNFGLEEDIVHGKWDDNLASIKSNSETEKVGAVVVGFDEHYSFMKMLRACNFLTCNPHCEFLATNFDAVHRYPKYCIPGTGAILESLQACVGKKAKVMGKPNPSICENLIKTKTINPKTTLMIGDCAKNDVLFGRNCGFHTLLVGTGMYKWCDVQELLENKEANFTPNYYLDSLGDLLPFLY